MKNFNIIFFCIILIAITSCKYKSDLEYKDHVIDSLQIELEKLKETPDVYFHYASDQYEKGNFTEAINKLESLINRFPSENYKEDHKYAETLIKKYKYEENSLITQVLNKVKILNARESIILIEDTQNEYSFSEKLNIKLIESLDRNKKLYEDQQALIEAEEKIGVKIISIKSYWKSTFSNDFNEMLAPELKIKIKNISDNDIEELKVKATFIQSNNEVLGTNTDYTVYYGDTSLKPGQIKLAIVASEIGYLDPFGYKKFDLPDVKAEIYINDIYYKSVWITKEY